MQEELISGVNRADVTGTILSAPEYSHTTYDEKFYQVTLETKRKSGTPDNIPVVFSERLINPEDLKAGERVRFKGQFRSLDKEDGNGRKKLLLFLFVREVITDNVLEHDENYILLTGYLCKDPAFRKTPKGREIAETIIACRRTYRRSDYVPCIVWGRNARYASGMKSGDLVDVEGRIQSRNYWKRHEDGTQEQKTVYEVSVTNIIPHQEEIDSIEEAPAEE